MPDCFADALLRLRIRTGPWRYRLKWPIKAWRRGREEAGLTFKHNLSVCAIAKDEGAYFREWLEFHRLVGVEKFYIYDNESSDNIREVLAPYIEAGIVEYTWWPGTEQQIKAYTDCQKKHAYDTRWLTYIDLDEFMVPVETRTIPEFLEKLAPEVSQVVVWWVVYGSDGHETKPEGLVTQNYMHRMPDHTRSSYKTIFKPRMIAYPRIHYHKTVFSGKTIDENGKTLTGRDAEEETPSYNKIRINHYICKSWEEYKNRRLSGGWFPEGIAALRNQEHFAANDFRDVYDPIMEQYADALKGAL